MRNSALRSLTLATLTAVLALGTAGCANNSSGATMGPEPQSNALPPIKVDLPPPPAFTPSDIPEQYGDGTWSIRGLRKDRQKELNQTVKVKGYLLEVYQCPKCPHGQKCNPCDQPHFFIGDKADSKKEKSMMVVDYQPDHHAAPHLTVGKQYTISGQFAINSPSGFGASNGLLVVSELIDDHGKKFQSQDQALEQKALNGEAVEADLRARAHKK